MKIHSLFGLVIESQERADFLHGFTPYTAAQGAKRESVIQSLLLSTFTFYLLPFAFVARR